MIIDCHGHYTTAPKSLEEWRNRQVSALRDPAARPSRADLKISDDEIRERIASPKMLPEGGSLPHLICSPPQLGGGGDDEAGEHGNTR